MLQTWSSGSNREPAGQPYCVSTNDPFRNRLHRKYVVQLSSLGLRNLPFSEQLNSCVLFLSTKHSVDVEVVKVKTVVGYVICSEEEVSALSELKLAVEDVVISSNGEVSTVEVDTTGRFVPQRQS